MRSSDLNCPLCNPELGPIVWESACWKLALNWNQNLLGKCFLALGRHLESVADLTQDEWADLHAQLKLTTGVLMAAFGPDHFNYVFLQNQDRHVHLHIVPRYAAPRTFSDMTFGDPDYPAHYAVPAPVRRLSREQLAALAGSLRALFEQAASPSAQE